MVRPPAPPGPRGRFLGGSLAEFARDRLGFFTRCARDYGDVVSFRLGAKRCLLLNHPDAIEEVLVTQSRHFSKHFVLRNNRLLLGNGLITSEGDFWLRQRRLAQPAFLRERMAAYADVMVTLTQRMLADWHDGQARDIHADMMQLTLEIVTKTLFGADAAGEADAVRQAVEVLLAGYAARLRILFFIPQWIPTPTHRRMQRARRSLDAILYRIIDQRRGAHGSDLLSLLQRARDEDGSGMTDQQLRDEAMTLFLAGHETTALALAWAWYALAQHPEVEARLADELHQVLNGRAPAATDWHQLRYTGQVVDEVLRLYPPVYAIGREALSDCRIGGYRVARGTTVLMSQWSMHRDARYFPDPERFDPDRWTPEMVKELPKYAYFPFGGGPRLCIGNSFAHMEAVLVLATIASRFRLTLLPGHPVEPCAFFTLRPAQGIPVIVVRRS